MKIILFGVFLLCISFIQAQESFNLSPETENIYSKVENLILGIKQISSSFEYDKLSQKNAHYMDSLFSEIFYPDVIRCEDEIRFNDSFIHMLKDSLTKHTVLIFLWVSVVNPDSSLFLGVQGDTLALQSYSRDYRNYPNLTESRFL